MFESALKSGIPIIGVHTDDLVNLEAVLYFYAKKQPVELAENSATSKAKLPDRLYYTDEFPLLTVDLYKKLLKDERQLVFLNPDKESSLIFDVGSLPTPTAMIEEFLLEHVEPENLADVMQACKGLSLKAVGELLMFTQARTGSSEAKAIRASRMMLGKSAQGLYPIDVTFDFYDYPERIQDWLDLNTKYFLDKAVPHMLRPRGLLLDGPPGTGKTMAAKAIAKGLSVPLYRLDVATTLNRYIGESEGRLARSLAMVERESPCVLLLDEIEKVFNDSADSQGVTSRMLSQMLWWLSEHQSQVITIMTTNDQSVIPEELYRPGRVDMVIKVARLSISDAANFTARVFESVIGEKPTTKQFHLIREELKASGEPDISHAEATVMVYDLIKRNGWFKSFLK
jgi:SpoVK/Ycf46/Vps4 family AAA+-type ATPase